MDFGYIMKQINYLCSSNLDYVSNCDYLVVRVSLIITSQHQGFAAKMNVLRKLHYFLKLNDSAVGFTWQSDGGNLKYFSTVFTLWVQICILHYKKRGKKEKQKQEIIMQFYKLIKMVGNAQRCTSENYNTHTVPINQWSLLNYTVWCTLSSMAYIPCSKQATN